MIGGRKTKYDSSILFLVIQCHQKKIIQRIESVSESEGKKKHY
jgi:hypothetical protein